MTMIAVRPEDRVSRGPEPRGSRVRPSFLNEELLSRAKRDGEAQLLAIIQKLRSE